jgi:hypothetical protein
MDAGLLVKAVAFIDSAAGDQIDRDIDAKPRRPAKLKAFVADLVGQDARGERDCDELEHGVRADDRREDTHNRPRGEQHRGSRQQHRDHDQRDDRAAREGRARRDLVRVTREILSSAKRQRDDPEHRQHDQTSSQSTCSDPRSGSSGAETMPTLLTPARPRNRHPPACAAIR